MIGSNKEARSSAQSRVHAVRAKRAKREKIWSESELACPKLILVCPSALACEVGRESQAPVRSDWSSGHGSSQSYFPDVCGTVQYNARSVCPHIKLSLRVASKKVSNLSVSFRSINDMPEETVVGDYVKLYADAVSQLNESISKFKREKKNGGNWLTKRVVGDVKTWISAAMTDDETCSDGLEEMGTVVGNEIKKEMFTVNQMMSISLAIVSQMKKLLIIFH
ncbi:BnaC01g42800D [Brassica napus]|uniref:Pectinesterase inhibitor domain-containing protein n=2 Tax=Brassica TaxID=3705 RepID=A0A0D3A8Z8_BRAOL|nr:unnamed protein product [Brassica napus]CDY53430.1 BnaC01g42800D [Brassica napus]